MHRLSASLKRPGFVSRAAARRAHKAGKHLHQLHPAEARRAPQAHGPRLRPRSSAPSREMSVDLRCRLTQGDIGPFTVARTLSVQGVKEQLLRRWPQGAGTQDAGTWWPARELACVLLAWPAAALRQCAVC